MPLITQILWWDICINPTTMFDSTTPMVYPTPWPLFMLMVQVINITDIVKVIEVIYYFWCLCAFSVRHFMLFLLSVSFFPFLEQKGPQVFFLSLLLICYASSYMNDFPSWIWFSHLYTMVLFVSFKKISTPHSKNCMIVWWIKAALVW